MFILIESSKQTRSLQHGFPIYIENVYLLRFK